jgi:hypothetical protein
MLAAGLLGACSDGDDGPSYPSAQGKTPPYVLKEGCSFAIVEKNSRSSIDSPQVSGMHGASASASISLGDYSITVADCRLVENPQALPVYED